MKPASRFREAERTLLEPLFCFPAGGRAGDYLQGVNIENSFITFFKIC